MTISQEFFLGIFQVIFWVPFEIPPVPSGNPPGTPSEVLQNSRLTDVPLKAFPDVHNGNLILKNTFL